MPTPVGHALGGIVLGALVGGGRDDARRPGGSSGDNVPAGVLDRWRAWASPRLPLFAALGALPDIDFLAGMHSRQTHSIGAVLILFLALRWMARGRRRSSTLAAAAALAYGSHILLDWLGSDTSVPIGVMALWPFSHAFYQSDLHWFPAIWRDPRPGLWAHNVRALVWEVSVLGPLAVAAWWGRPRRSGMPR